MSVRHVALAVAGGVLLAAALVVVVGCGSGSGGSASGGSTSAAALAGTSWRLTGWSVGGQDPDDFTITAEFAGGRIGGKSAVNQYGGPYTAGDDGSFSVGELVSTMMAGPEADMTAETTYLDLLKGATAFAIQGDALTLSDPLDDVSLTYKRSQASPSP